MTMDPPYTKFSDSTNGFKFNDLAVFPTFTEPQSPPDFANTFQYRDDSSDINFLDLPLIPLDPDPRTFITSSEVSSPDDFSDTVFKYLNQILMEEKMEEKPSMFYDPLALQAAEKSFYEVIGEKYPASPPQFQNYIDQTVENRNDNFFASCSENSTNSSTSGGDNSVNPQWAGDSLEFKSTYVQAQPLDYFSQSNSLSNSNMSFGSINSFTNNVNAPVTHQLVSNIFSDSESMLQFKRGMEEASKFLPRENPLIINLEKYSLPVESNEGAYEVLVEAEKDEVRDNSPNGSRGKKHYHREDSGLQDERSSKQSAVYVDEADLSDMFDKVLLFNDANGVASCCNDECSSEVGSILQQNGQTRTSSNRRTRTRKQGNKSEVVDLSTLLASCAQSVAADDRRSATEQLKQIRQHSSPSGDATQRLAHIFANGLEARWAGTGTEIYAALASKRISAAEKLKAYQVFLSACPFKKISIFFANKMILDAASEAKTLHIIDFGIQYGFQWPILIQYLSQRTGGPPKLRITGIEHPQRGFRPTERLEETGRRLANYCERFNVPFEYHAIATQKWETIKIEDLKIESSEFLAVNTLFRFENLLDETVVVESPRDAVLKLIRKMNPDIFVHGIVNGSYSAPFFVTRFREALFHYSSKFDMFDHTLSREDPHRMNFEQEFYGREIMNVVACEGSERVERPETYKQWQVRNMRAGFRSLPLSPELVEKFRGKVKKGYHKDFVFDEDGHWMMQGWKGRILYASSCWVPA